MFFKIYDDITKYAAKKGMTLEAVHAGLWVDGFQFLKCNFLKDVNQKGTTITPKKLKKYNDAFDCLKTMELEDTASLRQTLDYFEERNKFQNLDNVFPREGTFSYRGVRKMLDGDKIPAGLYDYILGYLLKFEEDEIEEN